MPQFRQLMLAFMLALPIASTTTIAQDSQPSVQDATEPAALTAEQQQMQQMFERIQRSKITGPASTPLLDNATLNIPKDFIFVPAQDARAYLEMLGNLPDNSVQGILIPTSEPSDWMMVISYHNVGFIKDDDAQEWDVDGLLSNIQDGVKEMNEKRSNMQIPALEVTGWIEKPNYDSHKHQLVWSLAAHEQGKPSGPQDLVNYNTYALGREGYFSMDLITNQADVEKLKPSAKSLLQGLDFVQGHRYQDFDSSTDQVAAYGVAALVGGGLAAKKLGFFALIAAFFAKFFKVILVALIAGAGMLRQLFKGKSS